MLAGTFPLLLLMAGARLRSASLLVEAASKRHQVAWMVFAAQTVISRLPQEKEESHMV